MANNETTFKAEFRRDLKKHYGDDIHVWTSNDMFKSGIADFNVSFESNYFAMEAKFVKKLPVRLESLVLSHDVSEGQFRHLMRIHNTGNFGIVLIGMPNIAIAVPITEMEGSNISLGRLKKLGASCLSSVKDRGRWRFNCSPHGDFLYYLEAFRDGRYSI